MLAGHLPTFDVDLHAVRDGNRLSTLLTHIVGGGVMPPRIEPGDWVQVRDEMGGFGLALVDDVVCGRRLSLKVDWATWQDPPKFTQTTDLIDALEAALARAARASMTPPSTQTDAIRVDLQDIPIDQSRVA